MADTTQQAEQRKADEKLREAADKRTADQEEYDRKRKENPEELATKDDEPVHFDCTIAKLVKYTDNDGNETWEEVMSDTLYPGEKLKRVEDDKSAFDSDERARREAAKEQRGVSGDQGRTPQSQQPAAQQPKK